MNSFGNYEQFIEEFSYKSYTYVGDVIRLAVEEEDGSKPSFVMQSPILERNLDTNQKEELGSILDKAMGEILRNKPEDKSVREFLGWD